MRHTWNMTENPNQNEENDKPHKIMLHSDFRSKLKVNLKAIEKYNDISTNLDDTIQGYDNFSYIPENVGHYESNISTMSSTRPLSTLTGAPNILPPLTPDFYKCEDFYEYSTIRSSGGKSDTQTEITPRASTNKLAVRPQLKDKCNTCLGYVETVLCAVSLACGLGNVFRLPQAVLSGGGLPFLIAYIILAVLVGLPLLTLEIGLGQIVQKGFMQTWRAVPFFRGIGYIKLMISCLLTVYYSLYMGLAIYYILWFAQGGPPFSECVVLRMEQNGYKASGVSGQQCIKKTFLENPFNNPYWYGIFIAILFCLWVITTIWLLKRTKTYVIALQIYLFTTMGCLIALIVKAAQYEEVPGIVKFGEDADWTILGTADVWYHAAIQVFFSMHLGMGIFITNSGIIFKKVNPVWTAFGFVLVNLIVGVVVVLLVYAFAQELDQKAPVAGDITQIHLLTLIYDITLRVESQSEMSWSLIAYFLISFSGFISVTALLYTIFKAITNAKRQWLPATLCTSFGGFVICALILLCKQFQIVHLLDHYVVGNLIIITIILEVFSFICFYGSQRLQSDFEFILGSKLPKLFVCIWWFCPIVLLGIFIWGVATLPLDGYLQVDPVWIYATGWSIVLLSLIFIVVMGLYHTSKLDEYYTYADKFKAAFKFSRKWGPIDPIMRYNWVQWHSKAKDGQRDFTLRRRGTRDYTHSVKNRSKYNAKKYTVGTASDSSMNTDSIAFRKNDQNQNNITLMNLKNYNEPYVQQSGFNTTHLPQSNNKPLRIRSWDETTEHPANLVRKDTYGGKTTNNPLVNLTKFKNDQSDCGQSEGYGTFRNGPYVIDSEDVDHVCHRKSSVYSEEATVL